MVDRLRIYDYGMIFTKKLTLKVEVSCFIYSCISVSFSAIDSIKRQTREACLGTFSTRKSHVAAPNMQHRTVTPSLDRETPNNVHKDPSKKRPPSTRSQRFLNDCPRWACRRRVREVFDLIVSSPEERRLERRGQR